ncbi:MAG: hypothetical protein ACRD5J_16135 [Nitrososphaeraceae archaeon]
MSTAKAQSKVRLVRSENKWGRSSRRHFARQNPRKKTSDQYKKKFKNVRLSQFRADSWIPCPSGYNRGQGWNCLFRAWLGYKIAANPKNGESFQDRLRWAITIQNIQTDLGIQRTSFPTLGLEGDYVFTYSISKQMELEDLDNEIWLKEYKKKRRTHIQEIVDASMLTDCEKEWMKEYALQTAMHPTSDDTNRYAEHIVMPNLFDMRRNSHN